MTILDVCITPITTNKHARDRTGKGLGKTREVITIQKGKRLIYHRHVPVQILSARARPQSSFSIHCKLRIDFFLHTPSFSASLGIGRALRVGTIFVAARTWRSRVVEVSPTALHLRARLVSEMGNGIWNNKVLPSCEHRQSNPLRSRRRNRYSCHRARVARHYQAPRGGQDDS